MSQRKFIDIPSHTPYTAEVMNYRYLVSVKRRTRILSDTALGILIAGGIMAPFLSLTLLWLTAAIIIYILYSMRLSARSITVTPSHLIISLRLGTRTIPMETIRSVRPINSIDMNWPLIPIRTLWGKNGTYRTPLLGRFSAYMGNPALPMIRIAQDDTSVVIALRDAQQLAETLHNLDGFFHFKKNN